MSEYTEFFLNSGSDVVMLDTLEFHHPDFTKDYFIVRNNVNGVTARLESPGGPRYFEYYPLLIDFLGVSDDLDFGMKVTMGDLGEILPNEIDAVRRNNGFATKPTVLYRTYRSDDLEKPVFGPLWMELESVTFVREGVELNCAARRFNITKTGEVYRLDRFPLLRSYL